MKNFKKNKTAAYLWSAGSVLFFVAIILFVFSYQPSTESNAEKADHILKNWSLVSNIWRIEVLAVILLNVSSWYFATVKRSIAWFLITFGHIIMVMMYATMLGSYPDAAESFNEAPYLFPLFNNMAIWIFGLSNFLFLTGLTFIYFTNKILNTWVNWLGGIISSVGLFGSLALFFELLTFEDLNTGGPLILILYLLNAYLGFQLAKED